MDMHEFNRSVVIGGTFSYLFKVYFFPVVRMKFVWKAYLSDHLRMFMYVVEI